MSLKEQVYSVLLVSAEERANDRLPGLLPPSLYHPVRVVGNVSEARRLFSERSYDFVLINSPLPDDAGARFAADICSSSDSVVLLLMTAHLLADISDKARKYGVFILPKPTSRQMFMQALDWMISTRERLRKYEKKTVSIEEKMKEIKIVNKAKWLLISELKMEEEKAHHYIERQAMDRCITKRQVAEEIIRMYS